MKEKISIVIAAYNEEKRIERTLEEITSFFDKQEKEYEIIVGNDGSKDRTKEIVASFSRKNPSVKLIDNDVNRGKGFVVRQGISCATGKSIIVTDADLAYPIEQIQNFIDASKEYDLVVGSRVHSGSIYLMEHQKFKSIFLRHLTSRVFNVFVRCLFGFPWKDTQCGLKVISPKMKKIITQFGKIKGFGYDVELFTIALHNDAKVTELPVKVIHSYTDSKIKMYKHIPLMFIESLRIKWNEWNGYYNKKSNEDTDKDSDKWSDQRKQKNETGEQNEPE
jgi:dolichyl-phosphate beta-glucosyltransferase